MTAADGGGAEGSPCGHSHFSDDWLAMREPHDRAARDAAAVAMGLDEALGALARRATPERPLRVLDLGAGTGANLRWLAPRIGGCQHWVVLDHDASLLALWPERLGAWARTLGGEVHGCDGMLSLDIASTGLRVTIERRQVDLAAGVPPEMLAGTGLITASALLDLVSERWLAGLVDAGRAAGVAAWLFALSVDGRIEWQPADADDEFVVGCYTRHQRQDKGFGPALGGEAPKTAARLLEADSYSAVRSAASDWRVVNGAMRDRLRDGMAAAAVEMAPREASRIRAWQERRTARSELIVGHSDNYCFDISAQRT